ncbi:hypothetical protein V8D89_005583 [Ganoderma adspersum]
MNAATTGGLAGPFTVTRVRHTYCQQCCKENSKFRCAGCQSVVYCSRECQKAAWSLHKNFNSYTRTMCTIKSSTDSELQASYFSYPSLLSHFNTLHDWIELRRWSLFTLTCALIQLEGSIDAVLGAQKVLVVNLIPAHRDAHDGNLARAFRLDAAALVDRDSSNFLRENWAYIQANTDLWGRTSANALLNQERSDAFTAPVGSLPVVYIARRTSMVSSHAFTLFRLPLRHVMSEDAADTCTWAALEDLVRLMNGVLYTPFVFHRAENPHEPQPDWGFLECTGRRGKTWKWRGVPADDQEQWRMWEKLLCLLMPGSTSDLTPLQVLTLFDYEHMGTRWWARDSTHAKATL